MSKLRKSTDDISPFMLALLYLWILFIVIIGLVEYNDHFAGERETRQPEFNFSKPEKRTEVIKINISVPK